MTSSFLLSLSQLTILLQGMLTRGVKHPLGQFGGCLVRSRVVYLYHSMPILQVWSGLPRDFPIGAHDWRQVPMFQGKSRSLFGSFTTCW
jgi:hypothetical protein